jgi:hypothetical protein
MHLAAGAREIFTFHFPDYRWCDGEDFEEFVTRLSEAPPSDYPRTRRTRWARAGWGRTRRARWRTAEDRFTTPPEYGSETPQRCRPRPG